MCPMSQNYCPVPGPELRRGWEQPCPAALHSAERSGGTSVWLTSPQLSAESRPWLLESCWMQLLTAMLLLPGARSSSGISTQPSERTAKH